MTKPKLKAQGTVRRPTGKILGVSITGDQLAKRAKISSSLAHRLARGERMPRIDTAMRVAEALGLTVQELSARIRAVKKRRAA